MKEKLNYSNCTEITMECYAELLQKGEVLLTGFPMSTIYSTEPADEFWGSRERYRVVGYSKDGATAVILPSVVFDVCRQLSARYPESLLPIDREQPSNQQFGEQASHTLQD